MPTLSRRGLLPLSLGMALVAGSAFGQSPWPQRPISLVVPFAAGGGSDAFARPLAQQLDGQLGVRVIIENRAGAGGTAGAASSARAAPDGYTFFFGATHHAIAPALYPKLSYDLETDFVPVAVVSRVPHVIVVNPRRLPVANLAEFLARARATPEGLTYASAGVGTTHHLAGELFRIQTRTPLRHVPYRGAGPAMADMVSGQVDVMFDGLGSASAQISGGTVKGLAVAAANPVPGFADLPTAAQAGLPGFEVSTWYALWAVKGTPPEIVARMTREVEAALQTPLLRETWARQGAEVPGLSGAAFGAFVGQEVARWRGIVQEAGVKLSE